jgi:hypothetical protein
MKSTHMGREAQRHITGGPVRLSRLEHNNNERTHHIITGCNFYCLLVGYGSEGAGQQWGAQAKCIRGPRPLAGCSPPGATPD